MVREMSHPHSTPEDARIVELERTLETLREDAEVTHVLLNLSAALAEVRSTDETLERAIEVVVEITKADRAYVAMAGPGEGLRIHAHAGFDAAGLRRLDEEASRDVGMAAVRRALAEGRPVLIGDTGVKGADAGPRAVVAIPLGRAEAAFGLEFDEPKAFGAGAGALARGIARQVGVALVNARRFALLAGLRAFGLSLASKLRPAGVIEEVAWASSSLLSGDAGSVYYLDAADRRLVAAGGLGNGDGEDLSERFARLDVSEGPFAALLEGRPVAVDLEGDPPVTAVAAPIPSDTSPMMGAIVVFFRRRVQPGDEDKEALSVLAAQAGMALEIANRFERQRQVARSLQAGLLSSDIPRPPGWDIGAFYEPASGEADIGGDFYDLFEVGSDRYALVVGDVSGKGAEAAARTAMAKYMLRAFASRNAAPSSALYYLNNALTQDLESDRFATLVYGLLDGPARTLRLARGGHPPPLVYRAETGLVEAYESIEGGILGAFPGQEFDEATIELEPGDVLLLYTDGLIEARSPDGAFYGRRRIEECLARFGSELPPHELTLRLYRDAQIFGRIDDDTVVFALRPQDD